MSGRAWVQVWLLTAVILLGVALGLIASFAVWPAACVDADPAHLTAAGRCRWASAAAAAYSQDGDLREAVRRLRLLGGDALGSLCRAASGDCPACAQADREQAAALLAALGETCESD